MAPLRAARIFAPALCLLACESTEPDASGGSFGDTRGNNCECRQPAEHAPAAEDKYWFTPNIGSADLQNLFSQPELWPMAREHVGVLQLYSSQFKAVLPEHCVMCGPNVRQNMIDSGVLAKIDEWGIELALEDGVIKPGACLARGMGGTVEGTKWAISIVEDAGGTVKRFTMDEPYRGGEMEFGGTSCHYTMQQTAAQTADWITDIRAHRPGIIVGDVEPWPFYDADEIVAWIDELYALGATLDHFHLDVDLNALKNLSQTKIDTELQQLHDAVEARNLPLGMIIIGNEWLMNQGNDKERVYYETALGWADEVERIMSRPEHVIVQSWVDSTGMGENGTTRVLPVNLPETGMYTHTRILNEVAMLWPTSPQMGTTSGGDTTGDGDGSSSGSGTGGSGTASTSGGASDGPSGDASGAADGTGASAGGDETGASECACP